MNDKLKSELEKAANAKRWNTRIHCPPGYDIDETEATSGDYGLWIESEDHDRIVAALTRALEKAIEQRNYAYESLGRYNPKGNSSWLVEQATKIGDAEIIAALEGKA